MRRLEIAITSRMSRGMRVRSSDGVFLGRVADVWCGTDPKQGGAWDHSVCSRIEIHPPAASLLQRLAWRRRPAGPALYVPCDAIALVSKKRVELGVEARVATERWTGEPMWIRQARAKVVAERADGEQGPFEHPSATGGLGMG